MELWIRSQDKEKLCKAHDLCVRENQNENNETNYVIQDIYTMETYKTKERAMQILDEIQELFIKKDIVKSELNIDGLTMVSMPITCIVYEMPNE